MKTGCLQSIRLWKENQKSGDTDADGTFEINVEKHDSIIHYKFFGYKEKEFQYGTIVLFNYFQTQLP
jgi:hypothetical protein